MNKRGFTLIELLAVISIISILLIISVPRIISQINNNKTETYENYKNIIITSGRNYVIDYSLEEPISIALSDLCDLKYIECPITNPLTNTIMNGYVNVDENKIYTYSEDDATYWFHPVLTVNLNGGTTTQTFESAYMEGATITLIDPTKSNNDFIDWSVSGTGSSITDGVLTIGEENTTITANWDPQFVYITINPNEGEYIGSTSTTIYDVIPGNTQDVSNPTRSGYVFIGWSLTCVECLSGTTYTAQESNDTLTAEWLAFENMYTYTGSSTLVDDGDGNWRIKFLTNGTFTPLIDMTIDAFLVGGGGGGRNATVAGAGGGGGGYAGTYTLINVTANTGYSITIGPGGARNSVGGTTTAFGYSKSGGALGSLVRYGCPGGSGGGAAYGGVGGSNGGNGADSSSSSGSTIGGTGQGIPTYEFGDSSLTLYSGGGGGGGGEYSYQGNGGAGGAGGGATGGNYASGTGYSAAANTGGGGGGGGASSGLGGAGGSGIVVIRNARINEIGGTNKFQFSFNGNYVVINGDTDNWKIKLLSSGTFTPFTSDVIDVFLVGGGSGGNSGGSGIAANSGGGGGGGTTATYTGKSITNGTDYSIVIGSGGARDSAGGTTSGFGYTATGGTIASYKFYGNIGGSGGGGGAQGYTGPGAGGSDGSDGYIGNFTAGTGQGTTTREFGDIAGTLYAGGGGAGGGPYSTSPGGASGGAGGGATGGAKQGGTGGAGTPNTGGGGGGGGALDGSPDLTNGGIGGSGIVVIRPN